jgi:hypothetical protein
MLTLFTLPKPFRGHINVIQRNAIESWRRLHPDVEIILFGDEEGTREAAQEFRARHEPEIRRYEDGAPLLDSIFSRAQEAARYNTLCYVNCDIVLMSDFRRALELTLASHKRFLMVSKRWNMDITAPLDFEATDGETRLRTLVCQEGKEQRACSIDYFAFTRNRRLHVPPFAIGRYRYDQWLIWKFLFMHVPVIDASPVVRAVHQNHDYSHLPEVGAKGGVLSEESEHALRNLRLAGGARHLYTIDDATHILESTGMRRVPGRAMRPYREAPGDATWAAWYWFLGITGPIRHRLGLRRGFLARAMGKDARPRV